MSEEKNFIGKEILTYRIESLIGKGGMGRVYLASNKHFIDDKVAIKVLNANLAESPVIRQKFETEAKTLLALDHPNIVHFRSFAENEDGIFLIMEYVDGITLDDFINTKQGLIVETKVYGLFDQILEAFAYAHKRGIIHRDIKPANIILTNDNDGNFVVKVLDFGIARIISESNEDEKGLIIGTPAYMSPEQVRGEDVCERSDIYSLGVLLHQMLTGHAPYDSTTLSETEIQKKVVEDPLPRMKEYYQYISDRMQKVVDKATAKDPAARYANCSAFRKDFLPKPPRPLWQKIAAAVVFILFLGGGYGFWDYNSVKVRYYKDYAEQWGVPQGIGRLSGSDTKHSHRHYRFEYKKYKLQRVSHVNSLNKIISDDESERNERPLDMLLFYGDNSKISYIKVLDNNGKVLYKKSYNDKLTTVIFQFDDEYSTEKTLSSQTVGYIKSFDEDISKKGKISRWLLEYDQNGFVSKVNYAGFQNVLVGDSHGIFGRKWIRDDKGRILEEQYLGSDGTPKATKWGMGKKKFFYDKDDNWIRSEYLTIDGEPSYDDADGISIYKLEYDKYGNLILALFCESNEELMLPKKHNVAGVSYSYDKNGFITQLMYLGIDKNPCFTSEGIAGYRAECDDNGFFNKIIFIDPEGNSCETSIGNSIRKFSNDEKGNQLETWTFDDNDQLIETTEGFAGYKAQYDSLGNVIELIYYGADGKPCLKKDGTAGYRAEYTEIGKVSKIVNLGVDLSPCYDNDGTPIWTAEYDKRGNRIKLTFYDETGEKLHLSNEGIAGWYSVYDENGNETERSFFDVQNKPCLVNGEYAKWVAKYDDGGNQIELIYYDLANKSKVTKEGYAGIKRKYDDRGNIIEELLIDAHGNLASNKLVVRYKYDKFDNEVEVSVFDRDNQPTVNSSGYFKYIKKYNERNQEIEVCYFGKDNKSTVLNGKKYSMIRYEYDNKGNSIQTAYFNVDNKPCISNDGYATHKSEYNNLGQVVRQTFFDVNGKPTNVNDYVPEGMAKYDKWGNMIYLAAGDGNGNLIINPNTGWAIMKKEFDIKGNELFVAYFDTDEKAIEPKNLGYAKSVSIYDKSGNKLEQKLYNKSGELRKGKYAIVKYKYDESNRNNETEYFDYNNKPCNGDNDWHREVYSMYSGDQAQLCKLYSANGSLLASYKRIDGEWRRIVPDEPIDSSLRSEIEKINRSCPTSVNDEIELTEAYMVSSSANTAAIAFRLIDVSMYNFSDSQKSEYLRQFTKLKENFLGELPSGSKLIVIVKDRVNRELFKIQ